MRGGDAGLEVAACAERQPNEGLFLLNIAPQPDEHGSPRLVLDPCDIGQADEVHDDSPQLRIATPGLWLDESEHRPDRVPDREGMTLHLKAGEVRDLAGVDLHRVTFSSIRFALIASITRREWAKAVSN